MLDSSLLSMHIVFLEKRKQYLSKELVLFTLALQTQAETFQTACDTSFTIEAGGIVRFYQQFEDSVEV